MNETDLGADRAQPRAVGRPSPPLLPALVGRRAEPPRSSPATRASTATRSRRSRRSAPTAAERAARAPRAAPPRRRGARPRAPLGRLRRRPPAATPATRRPPRPPSACAPGPPTATPAEQLVRLYAIESGQPQISRTKREGLLDRYGFADGAGTAYFRVHETRDVEHAAEARELIDEVGGRRRRGRARRRGGVGLPGQLAPARRGLSDGMRRGDRADRDRPRPRLGPRDRRRVRVRVQRGHRRRPLDRRRGPGRAARRPLGRSAAARRAGVQPALRGRPLRCRAMQGSTSPDRWSPGRPGGAVVALFFVLRDGDDDATTTTAGGNDLRADHDRGRDDDRRQATDGAAGEPRRREASGGQPEVATIVVKGGQPVGGVQELSFAEGEDDPLQRRVRRRRRGPPARLRRRRGGRGRRRRSSSTSRPTIEGVFEVELEQRVVADRRDHRQPRLSRGRCPLAPARGRRPRAGRPPGPADPGVAVRLGRLAGADRLVRRAHRRLAQRRVRGRRAGGRCAGGSRGRCSTRCVEVLCGALGVFLLGVTVWAGLQRDRGAGPQLLASPSSSSPSGSGWSSSASCFGDVFVPSTPGGRSPARRRRRSSWSPASRRRRRCAYPERLGRWPAAVGLVAFVWLELVYGQGGFQTVGLDAAHRRGRDPRLHRLHVRRA